MNLCTPLLDGMLQLLILTPGAVGGGLAVFGAVLEVLNSDRKIGLSKECRSRRVTPAWLKNLRELPEPKYCQVFHSLALVPIPDLILNCIKPFHNASVELQELRRDSLTKAIQSENILKGGEF